MPSLLAGLSKGELVSLVAVEQVARSKSRIMVDKGILEKLVAGEIAEEEVCLAVLGNALILRFIGS